LLLAGEGTLESGAIGTVTRNGTGVVVLNRLISREGTLANIKPWSYTRRKRLVEGGDKALLVNLGMIHLATGSSTRPHSNRGKNERQR